MSWIVIVWALMASACVTVGLMHLVIWLRQPSRDTQVYFVAVALSVAVIAAFEVLLMREDVAEGHSALLNTALIASPYLLSAVFLSIVLAMSHGRGVDAIRSGRLAGELRASETHSHEIERRMDLAVAAAGLGTWEWDVARDDIRTSDKGRALLGFTPSEPVDLAAFLGRVSVADRERVRKTVYQSLKNGTEHELEFRVLSADSGQPVRWMFMRGRVELGTDGRPVLMHGVVFDVTERHRMESEALQQRSELTHLSRVAMLGELSGSLAHQLNQPLAAILSNAQAAQRFLAQGTASIGEVRQILGDIVEEDKRAGDLIQRLRILFKKGEIQLEPLDANELVQDVIRLMRSDLISRRVSASSELAPQLPRVGGDPVQLQQVLLNLLRNAADSTPEGVSRVQPVVVRTARMDGGDVRISVTDQGRGIPLEDLQRVFEPFMTTKSHGMGLGLTVCRTIIRAHGGRIWAENNEGSGATFHFTLPTTRQQAP